MEKKALLRSVLQITTCTKKPITHVLSLILTFPLIFTFPLILTFQFGLVQKNSKEKFEVVNRRRTDNTIAKGKGQTMIYKTLHRKLTPLNTGGELMCFERY
jgi:hypothetical protein